MGVRSNRTVWRRNPHRFIVAVALLLAALAPSALAENHNTLNASVVFQTLDIDDGLSQMSVSAMLEDRRGFLWLGTQSGLNRFDGYNFKVYRRDYRNPDSLPGDYILDLAEAPDGRIWIATMSNGLAVYDPEQDRFDRYRHDPDQPDSLRQNRLNAVVVDPDGAVWTGTSRGLSRLDLATGKFRHFDSSNSDLPDDRVLTLELSEDGVLWVGTGAGLAQLEDNAWQAVLLSQRAVQPEITAIALTADRSAWIGTTDGVYRLQANQDVRHYRHDPANANSLSDNQIESVLVDRDGEVWIGTQLGLNHLRASGHFIRYYHRELDPWSVAGNRIASMIQDRTGILWFGSWTGGVSRYNARAIRFHSLRIPDGQVQADNRVRCFLENSDGTLLVGTLGGLSLYDPRTNRFFDDPERLPGSLSSNEIHALARAPDGAIWVGTRSHGLNRYVPGLSGTETFRHDPQDATSLSSDRILALHVADDGTLWVATWDAGISVLPFGETQFKHYRHVPGQAGSLSGDSVSVLFKHDDGALWIGTRGDGLNRYDPATDRFDVIPPEPDRSDGLLHGTITSMLSRDGSLWVATQGAGVGRLVSWESTAAFDFFTHHEGLASNAVGRALLDEDGLIWVSTLAGVSSIDPTTGQVQNFYAINGTLPTGYYVYSGVKTSTGLLMFGGIDGLTRFVSTAPLVEPDPPLVHLLELRLSNRMVRPRWAETDSPLARAIDATDYLELDHTQTSFGFEFTGLHFAEPERNRFAYQLQGYDRDWVETGADFRHATYTNLDPGSYQFRVKAANNDGVWSEHDATVNLRLKPAPWDTWWAWLAYILSAIFLVSGILRMRQRQQEVVADAAEAIRASEEKLKLALWGSGDEAWLLDVASGHIARTSGGGVDFEPRDGVRDIKTLTEQVHPEDVAHMRLAMARTLADRAPHFEATYRVKLPGQDQWTWLLSKGRVISRDAEGHPITVAGATKDITRLKVTEQELRTLNEKLESRVQERTADLSRANESLTRTLRRLREAQNQLVESEKLAALGGLVAGVAHEINTPLGVAITAASHLETQTNQLLSQLSEPTLDQASIARLSKRLGESASFVLQNLHRAADLVRGFKQVAVDQSSNEIRTFNLSEYLDEILRSLQPKLKRTLHQIEVDCPNDIVMSSDPGALYQIIINLVMNSLIHAYKDGEAGTLRIDALADGDFVNIIYRDDGCGFDANIRHHIFEPFFTTRRGQGGSGLGMHIVYNLVTQVLKGAVNCQSEPGQGMRVMMEIPKVVN